MDESTTESTPMPSQSEFETLVRDANSGNQEALARLRDILDRWPEIWKRLGDLAQHVQLTLINKIVGNNLLLRESITRGIDELRAELIGGSGCSPLEKLAIERVIASWLHVQSVDAIYPSTDGMPHPTARFVLQLRESTQRRLDLSIKSLATLRRLLAETPAQKRATLLRLHAGA